MSISNAVRAHLDGLGSKFARVTFVKKDGSIRDMTVQRACEKFHVTGGRPEAVLARRINHPEFVNVWSVGDKAFRSINVNAVLAIASEGQTVTYRQFASTPATGLNHTFTMAEGA